MISHVLLLLAKRRWTRIAPTHSSRSARSRWAAGAFVVSGPGDAHVPELGDARFLNPGDPTLDPIPASPHA